MRRPNRWTVVARDCRLEASDERCDSLINQGLEIRVVDERERGVQDVAGERTDGGKGSVEEDCMKDACDGSAGSVKRPLKTSGRSETFHNVFGARRIGQNIDRVLRRSFRSVHGDGFSLSSMCSRDQWTAMADRRR